MANETKTQKSFKRFLDSMEHLNDAVLNVASLDEKWLSADDWENIAMKCDKLANEFDKIYDNLEGMRNED